MLIWTLMHVYEYDSASFIILGYNFDKLSSKFWTIPFQEHVTKGISHPVFYGDLVYKLKRARYSNNFIPSGTKIVKQVRRRQYDQGIIEKIMGLVLGPSTTVYRFVLKHCTLTNKAMGSIWPAVPKPPQRWQGTKLCPLGLLVGCTTALWSKLAYR